MKRKELKEYIENLSFNNLLLELGTGYGKSKIAIDIIKKKKPKSILIVIPKLVLIENWLNEFNKWGCKKYIPLLNFVTYVSYPKKAGKWDMVIYDECHHLSERCRDYIPYYDVKTNLLLSATVGRNLLRELFTLFPNLKRIFISAKEAIADNILPDPRVLLIPLKLDNINSTYYYPFKVKKDGRKLYIPIAKKWAYASNKTDSIYLQCTQKQYYNEITSLISYYKQRASSVRCRNMWLKLCGDRLKVLSEWKEDFVLSILNEHKDSRTLTFCKDIAQTNKLGSNSINSKNKDSQETLKSFNEGKINHITACDMLNEGINLENCQIGIYAYLNSSDRLIVQKLGRLLRHPEPLIIIPYFKDTREEEIVTKMCENYNKDLITIKSEYLYETLV